MSRHYGLNSIQSIVVVLPLFFAAGVAMHQIFYSRLQRSDDPELASFLAFFGVSLVITSVILLIWRADPRSVPFPFSKVSLTFGPVFLSMGRLISAGICVAAIIALSYFLYQTYTGKAVRAIIENREAVSILGIDVQRVSALVFGIFIEPLPGIVVLVPILAPIAHALGIDDLQFGIVVIVNLTMGMITPPVGGLLFVTSIVARVPLARLVRELWPFLWAQVAVLALLSLFPALSAALPNALGYR